MPESSIDQRTVRFGVFELDPAAAALRKRGQRVKLEAQPYQVLCALARRPGELVTREELRQELWPADTFVEFDHSLNTAVKKIRQALGDSPRDPRYVETVPRQGYRFIAEVAAQQTIPDPPLESPAPTPPRQSPILWIAGFAAVAVVVAAAVWFASRESLSSNEPLSVVPLTTYPGDEQRPSFSPDGDEVAFQWNRDGNWDIYVKQIGVEEAFQLTDHPADELGPAWSPKGDQIAFVRVLSEPSRTQVILAPQRGGPDRILTEFRAHFMWDSFIRFESGALAWTPGGEWLIIAGKNEPSERLRLFRVSPGSGERIPLTSPEDGALGDTAPAVSPDGRTLVFARNGELWTLPLAEDYVPGGRAERVRLKTPGGHYPAWTLDSKEILFTARYHSPTLQRLSLSQPEESEEFLVPGTFSFHPSISGHRNMMVYAADSPVTNIWQISLVETGGRTPTPLILSSRSDFEPAYSPDGRRIAFSSWRTGALRVWVCNSDGTEQAELAPFPAYRPRWSPNGDQIVFQAAVEGNTDIYVVKTSGGVPTRLTTDPGLDMNPEWSSDGRWVYFLSWRDGTKRTWKIREDGGEPIPMDVPGGDTRESPDGKFLYYERDWEAPEKHSIWRVPTEGGKPVRVVESPSRTTTFDIVEDGIYYVGRRQEDGTSPILFKNVTTGELETIAVIEEATGWGLTVSPDRKTLLYVQQDSAGSDLMLVENFR